MHNNKKLTMSILSFATAFICLIGGTYAWYAVSNTTVTQFSGNTLSKSEGLGMGVLNDTAYSAAPTVAPTSAKDILAFKSTGFKYSDATWNNNIDLAANLKANGYAYSINERDTKPFMPATSGDYDKSINGKKGVDLYTAPKLSSIKNGQIKNKVALADKKSYAEFTLVFSSMTKDTEIYLDPSILNFSSQTAAGEDSEDDYVIRALRVGFTSSYVAQGALEATTTSSILTPYYLEDQDPTAVGGKLDLNGDYCWDADFESDFNIDGIDTSEKVSGYRTTYYGDYVGEETTPLTYTKVNDDETIKPSKNLTNQNPFGAYNGKEPKYLGFTNDAFKKDVYKFNDVVAKTQETYGVNYYTYDLKEGAENHPLTTTSTEFTYTDENGNQVNAYYGSVNVKIWLEGWDLNCRNDYSLGTSFSYTLGFSAPSLLSAE